MDDDRPTLAAPTLVSVALVDLFNVGPGARTDHDYEDLMNHVGDLVRRVLVPPVPVGHVHDVDCRLYGGFMDRTGAVTEQFVRTQRQLRTLTGIQERIRIRPQLVRSLACLSMRPLIGTYKNRGQNMVDQMLGQDLLYYAYGVDYDYILLIANDDDYVPTVLTAAVQTRRPIRWLRRRPSSENDPLLLEFGVTFLMDGTWA